MKSSIEESPWLYAVNGKNGIWLMLDEFWLWNMEFGGTTKELSKHFCVSLNDQLEQAMEWCKTHQRPHKNDYWTAWVESYSENNNGHDRPSRCPRYPWNNPATRSHHKAMWAMLGDVYEWRLVAPTLKNRYGKKFGRGYKSVAYHYGFEPTETWKNMIRWLNENGDPTKHRDWVSFRDKHEEE